MLLWVELPWLELPWLELPWLVTVLFDPEGVSSVAVLRDTTTNERHRVKVGDDLGRLHVTAIHRKSVTFSLDELGYRRKETIVMGDSVPVHTP